MEVSTDAQMGKADFVRTKYFARAADCVVFRMIEIVVVGNVGANLRREELRIEGRLPGARIAVQPGPVGKSKRLCSGLTRRLTASECGRFLLTWLRQRCRITDDFVAYHWGRLARISLCRRFWIDVALFQARLKFLNAGAHSLQLLQDFGVRSVRAIVLFGPMRFSLLGIANRGTGNLCRGRLCNQDKHCKKSKETDFNRPSSDRLAFGVHVLLALPPKSR